MKTRPDPTFTQLTMWHEQDLAQDKYIVKLCNYIRAATPKWSKSYQDRLVMNVIEILALASLSCGIDTQEVYRYVLDFHKENSLYQLCPALMEKYNFIKPLSSTR